MTKPPKPETEDLFDLEDEAAEERTLATAEAEMDAGKGIPWEKVKVWLGTWGTPEERPSVFTETGAYLNDTAMKAFVEGMKNVEPTPALIETMALAKNIRQP